MLHASLNLKLWVKKKSLMRTNTGRKLRSWRLWIFQERELFHKEAFSIVTVPLEQQGITQAVNLVPAVMDGGRVRMNLWKTVYQPCHCVLHQQVQMQLTSIFVFEIFFWNYSVLMSHIKWCQFELQSLQEVKGGVQMELLVLGLGKNATSLSETILMFGLSDTYINVTPFFHSFLACCLCSSYSFS